MLGILEQERLCLGVRDFDVENLACSLQLPAQGNPLQGTADDPYPFTPPATTPWVTLVSRITCVKDRCVSCFSGMNHVRPLSGAGTGT